MRCPFCGNVDDKVVDSRLSRNELMIRRRRECLGCKRRFTTYERIEEMAFMVVKSDGRREPFDRSKLVNSILKATTKRPVSMEQIEKLADDVERELTTRFECEVPSTRIGELVMSRLRALDGVAYIRFASVYQKFGQIGDFIDEIRRVFRESNPDPEELFSPSDKHS